MTPDKQLQIKEWTGIDRGSDGTTTPQNRFFTIQNMHPDGPGELASISGVVDQSGVPAAPIPDMPGVGKIIGTRFMRDAYNNPLLLAFYRPSASLASWRPVVAAGDLVATGSATDLTGKIFAVVYVGPGGFTQGKLASTPAAATTLTYTLPTGADAPPDWVAQVDIYIDFGETWMRKASLRRKADGTFPATVAFVAAFDDPTDASVTADPTIFAPDRIKSTHALSGGTQKYETWYFGAAPNFMHQTNKPLVCLIDADSPANFLSSEVEIMDGTTIEFQWALSKPAFGSGARMRVGDFDILRVLPFAGRTPEDLVHVGSATSSDLGRDVPIALSTVEYTITALNDAADRITVSNVSGSLLDGDRVVYRTNSGSITGYSDDTKYYFRWASTTTAYLYSSYDNYTKDIRVSISGSVTGSPKLFMLKASVFVKEESLFNSRNNCQMISTSSSGTAPYQNFIKDQPRANPNTYAAVASRTEGVFANHYIWALASSNDFLGGYSISDITNSIGTGRGVAPYSIDDIVGCWVFRGFPWTKADAHQLLPGVNERSLSQSGQRLLADTRIGQMGPNAFFNPTFLDLEVDERISSSQFRNRVLTANGDNIFWSTNGYTWKPIMRSDGKAQIPQSRYVQSFGSKVVASGGKPAIQNADNVFYHSEDETIFDWGTTINLFAVFSKGEVNGLGVFSQNLTDTGFAEFLVISKKDSIFIWDGSSSRGPQQLHYSFGFAGPKAFAVTDLGPIFVSRDNVWFIAGAEIKDIGDEVATILQSLTDAQLHNVNLTYHDRILKIGYPTGSGSDPNCDSELWFDFRTEDGELKKYITGPHRLAEFYDQDTALEFDGARDVRVSCLNKAVHQRDSGKTNLGSSIARSLVLSRLGLSKDKLKKLITQIDIAAKIEADETLTLTLNGEDGTATLAMSATIDDANDLRQYFQKLLTDRFAARINKLTLANTSSNSISFFDISIFFKEQNRSTLRF